MKRAGRKSVEIITSATAAALFCILTSQSLPAQDTPSAASAAATFADPNQPIVDPVTVLSDNSGKYSRDQRTEAARKVLARRTDESLKILKNRLVSVDDVVGEMAVAKALSEDGSPDPIFIDPLFPLLQDRTIADTAGAALAGYRANPDVLTRLIATLTQHNIPEFTRATAARTIGAFPEKRAAQTLMNLIDSPAQPGAVQDAAADGLRNMTGLTQFGRDRGRWDAWWQTESTRSDEDFRNDITASQGARLDRLESHFQNLDSEVTRLLRAQYAALHTDKVAREALALSFLRSTEPEIRMIGLTVLNDDIAAGPLPSSAELTQLHEMISDTSPDVRRTVADTLGRKLNDATALNALLLQLKDEPDPSVRQTIALALGSMHDLRAVKTLIPLLNDPSLSVAQAAAQSLGALADTLNGDAALKSQVANALADTALNLNERNREGLVASCIEAIAPLKDASIVDRLQKSQRLNPNRQTQDPAVRRAMVMAMGELRDDRYGQQIEDYLSNDADEDVQLQAIAELKADPKAERYAKTVSGIARPDSGRKEKVRAAAWEFMKAILPKMSESDLVFQAQQLMQMPEREVAVNLALADKQRAGGELDNLAATEQDIGHNYSDLKPPQYDFAAAHFKKALDIFDGGIINPGPVQYATAERSYVQALFDAKKFKDATDFAAKRIATNASEARTMGDLIYRRVYQLSQGSKDDVKNAQDLFKLAKAMNPPLDNNIQLRLQQIADQFPKGTSNADAPVEQQSASVDRN